MSIIHCPHCGSPVMVRGTRWECGWCGDFGALASLHPSEQKKLIQSSHIDIHDLEQGVLDICHGICEVYDGTQEAAANETAWKLAAYGITKALIPAKNQSSLDIDALQTFCDRYPVFTATDALNTAQNGKPAFEAQFLLTKEHLGSFWEHLLSKLPPYASYQVWPSWLFQTVDGLSQVESFFTHDDSSSILEDYQEMLSSHWDVYPILHPNRAALIKAVSTWDFSENEWACRDLLIADFPYAVRRWTAEELEDMDTQELLYETGDSDPQTAVQMMKLLLDTAESHLQEPEVAEQLLGWDMCDLCRNQFVQAPLLKQLKHDDRLARQLFQSAYVGDIQEDLLDACDWFGEAELKKHLYSLLTQNPHFEGFD